MEVTAILSRAATDYRKNIKFVVPRVVEFALDVALIAMAALVLMLAALAFLPSILMGDLEALLTGNVPFLLITIVVFVGLFLLFFLAILSAAARAAIISMSQETHANGATKLGTGLMGARKFTFGVFLFSVILGIVFLLLLAIALVPFALGSVPLGIFALVLAGILYVLFYLFVLFTPQLIVTRESGVMGGIKGSIEFVEKNFFQVIIYAAVVIAVSTGVALLTNVLGIVSEVIENQLLSLTISVFHVLFSIALSLLISPYFDIVKTYMVMEV